MLLAIIVSLDAVLGIAHHKEGSTDLAHLQPLLLHGTRRARAAFFEHLLVGHEPLVLNLESLHLLQAPHGTELLHLSQIEFDLLADGVDPFHLLWSDRIFVIL